MTQTDSDTSRIEPKAVYEELQVVGEQLLARVQDLIHEGNVRHIIIKQDGRTILEIPLSLGVVGIAALPQLAALGTICALVTKCSIEVVRTDTPAPTTHQSVEELHTDEGSTTL